MLKAALRLQALLSSCLFLAPMLLVLSGCEDVGRRGIPVAAVSGTVTLQGKPVTEGLVTFYSAATGIAASSPLNEQGAFRIDQGIEIGSYVVSVGPLIAEDNAGAPSPKSAEKVKPKIPLKYSVAEASGLKAEVIKGDNTYQFNLE